MPEPGAERITSRARCFDCDWGLACDVGETAFAQVYVHLQKCPGPVATLHITADVIHRIGLATLQAKQVNVELR